MSFIGVFGPLRLRLSDNAQLTGILCIIAGMLVIIGNDVAIKWMSGDYPIHQIVLTRSLVAIPITLLIAWFDGGWRRLKTRRPLLHLARGLLIVVANMCYFLALAAMPLADAMALFFVAPLFITALSVPMLGETVGIRRWLAVLAGLVGVLIMLRPASGVFQLAAMLPIIAALAYALMQMLTRRLGVTDGAAAMALYIQLTFVVVSAVIGLSIGDGRFAGSEHASLDFLLRAWHWPTPVDAGWMVFCGVCVAFGGYLLSQAYRLAQASVVAPFEYTALPWGVILGFLLWGEIPTPVTVAGMVLVVGSGLYVLYREKVRAKKLTPGLTGRSLR
jgi:drug/metabolite transporter (DMT)-like permease